MDGVGGGQTSPHRRTHSRTLEATDKRVQRLCQQRPEEAEQDEAAAAAGRKLERRHLLSLLLAADQTAAAGVILEDGRSLNTLPCSSKKLPDLLESEIKSPAALLR